MDRSIDSPKDFVKSNILGTYNLLEAIRSYSKKNKKIKLIHISTDEVYGDITNQKIRSNEKYAYKPSSPYSASKAGADQFIKSYGRTYGIKIIIAHPCNNYGPNQHPEKFIPKMIFNILNNRPLPVYGNGKNIMFRADMDGLPVEEKTGARYASQKKVTNLDGEEVFTMHACGHDVHMTVLIGLSLIHI